jgi:hypothetical protein
MAENAERVFVMRPVIPRRAYFVIVLGVAAMIVSGFWPSYFGPLLKGGVNRHWIIHVHASVFLGWVILLIAQASLVVAGRQDLHRRLGTFGIAYGVAVLVMGTIVSFAAPVVRVHAGQMPVAVASLVVLYNLVDMLVFGAFFAAAVVQRRHPEWHNRLILSATTAPAAAAVGRVLPENGWLYVAVWLSPLFASMLVDLALRRRLHPVSLISLPVFLLDANKVALLGLSTWPREIGRALIGSFV